MTWSDSKSLSFSLSRKFKSRLRKVLLNLEVLEVGCFQNGHAFAIEHSTEDEEEAEDAGETKFEISLPCFNLSRSCAKKNVLRTTWSVKLHQMVWPNLGFSDLHSAFFFLRSIQLTGDSRKNGFSSKQSDLWSNSWSRLSIHTVSQQLAWPKFGSSPVSRKKKQREKKPHLTTIAAPHSLTHSLLA